MSTGVRILPFDTVGYMFDGVMGSYQMVRKCQEFYAKNYPECIEQLRSDALALNRTHLRRLLSRAVQTKRGTASLLALDDYWLENLPRRDRRRWEGPIGTRPKNKFGATREYVTAVQQAHQRPLTDILRGFGKPRTKP